MTTWNRALRHAGFDKHTINEYNERTHEKICKVHTNNFSASESWSTHSYISTYPNITYINI